MPDNEEERAWRMEFEAAGEQQTHDTIYHGRVSFLIRSVCSRFAGCVKRKWREAVKIGKCSVTFGGPFGRR